MTIAPVRAGGIVAIGASDLALIGIGFAFPDTGSGTYPIAQGQLSNANVAEGGSSWIASSSQGSGEIIVSTLTATGTSGTFMFTAPLSVGAGPPATRVVTSGALNITF